MIHNIDLKHPIPKVADFGRRPTTPKCIACLLQLIETYCKENILEIGSWYGKTTYELATRFPKKKVFTMDYIGPELKLDPIANRALIIDEEELCKFAKHLENVFYLYQNSHIFDFDQFRESNIIIDFVFVDGDHSYHGLKVDTEKSIKMLKKTKGGIIAFHDIRVGHTDVPKYMKELSQTRSVYFFNNCNIGYITVGDKYSG